MVRSRLARVLIVPMEIPLGSKSQQVYHWAVKSRQQVWEMAGAEAALHWIIVAQI